MSLMGVLASVHLSVGMLIGLIGGLGTFAAALGGIGGFHAYRSAASGWKEERDAAVAKAERLETDVDELRERVNKLQAEVASLRAKDVSKLYDLMAEHHREMVEGAKALQARDEELFKKVKTIAEAVQKRRAA